MTDPDRPEPDGARPAGDGDPHSGSAFADLGRIVVVIPTYNEVENLGVVVARLRQALPEGLVLVVDDDSPDGTGGLADDLAAADPMVSVLHQDSKDGLGVAYLAGFAWAREHAAQVIVEMDADCSHQPEQLPRLLHALRHADLALGSRYVPGGSVQNWPLHRSLLSKGGNAFTRAALGLGLRDATSGFRAFGPTALARISLDDVNSAGYCFQVDLARRAVYAGLRVVEVPITFIERERGVSKMDAPIVREALWRITRWGLAYRARQGRRAYESMSSRLRERMQ